MNFTVKKEINPKDFVNIRKNLNWNHIPYDLAKKAIEGSMINISVFDNDKCVGIGRIVGDNALKGMLTDIMVLKEYQSKGIGKIIVTSLINELNVFFVLLKFDVLQYLYQFHLILLLLELIF